MQERILKQIKTAGLFLGVVLGGSAALCAAPRDTNSPPTSTNAPMTLAGTPIGSKSAEGFWRRLDEAFQEQMGQPAYVAPAPGSAAPLRRGLAAPFDSPPFPTGEWQIGGTEIIGDPNLTPDYPLMQAIYEGPGGQAVANSRIKFYGWEDVSGNVSSSHQSGIDPITSQAANAPLAYDQRPNRVEQNQIVGYLERTPDEYQTDHIDWGFRMSAVYGLDYRYMISRGWDSDQLVKENHFTGFDSPMMYFNLYIPNIAQGLNLTFGRIISEADIEAQLAPNNLMSTHSLLYTYDPYTQWGLFGTLKLNNNWTVQGGISAGNDVTPWELNDPGTQPTAAVMVQYQDSSGHFSFYGGGNAINNAEWGFNNIQQYVGTFTYKFNDKIWTSHETWYMYMYNSPGQPSKNAPGGYTTPVEPASENGGFGYSDAQIPVHPGYAPEWATLNYTMFRLAPGTFFTIRNELFNDIDGQRTGYATLYSEHSLGITYWPNRLITIRPEVRYDRTYGTHGSPTDLVDEAKPYDNGTRRQQFVASMDIIFHF